MSGDLQGQRPAGEGPDEWAAEERALLDAALEFYGAAEDVIDLSGADRPQLRRDAAGFDAIRKAMAALEERVRAARAAGVLPERIAEIARMEPEIVELILAGRTTTAPSPPEG